MNPLEVLKKYFGYDSFRHNQEAIINSVLEGRDTFVLMPTGGGKSLCYQVPALLLDGLTIVISPLIALMKDQVDALRLNGVRAAFINSSLDAQHQAHILKQLKSNEIKLLYVAPERLIGNDKNTPLLKKLSALKVSLIAIDEAHCVSHWGHDFRPDYLQLSQLKDVWPNVPQIALTATADQHTRTDIIEKLKLKNPGVFVSSFNRPNIRYQVERKFNSLQRITEFLSTHNNQSGIIYCLSRRSTETLAQELQVSGFKALAYHAGMDNSQRTRHQELFLKDEVKIMVATIAFGMGIDKSNVRFVIHMDVPKNLESYYQETGRAGRDGLDSLALLLYSPGDIIRLKKFVTIDDNPEQSQIAIQKLDQMAQYAESTGCRRKFILNYFDEDTPAYCGNCDACLAKGERIDATDNARKVIEAIRVLNEKFGVRYVVDFLWGATGTRIQPEHKQLKGYASGNGPSKLQWTNLINQLVVLGYLFKTEGLYPVLKITAKGNQAMDRNEKVLLIEATPGAISLNLNNDPIGSSGELLTLLKELRNSLAAKEQVAPYLILPDTALTELATYLPQTKEDLKNIFGFGDVKIKRYGSQVLALIAAHTDKLQLSSMMHLKAPKLLRGERVEKDSETKQVTLMLFNEGNSIAQIAERRALSLSTIEGHLAYYVQTGKLTVQQLVSQDKIDAIRKSAENLGTHALTPIRLSLGETYSFSEIRYVIADLESKKLEEEEIVYRIRLFDSGNRLHEPREEYTLIKVA